MLGTGRPRGTRAAPAAPVCVRSPACPSGRRTGRKAGRLLLPAALAFFVAGCGEKTGASQARVVERGPFEILRNEKGELAALRTLTISSKIRGQLVLVVKDMTHVEEGDVLAELDRSDLEKYLERTQDELAAVRKELEENERSLEIERAQLEVDIARKAAAFDLAGVHLETVRRGAEPEDISIAEKDVEAARAAMSFAESAHEDTKALAEGGFATEAEVADKRYDLELARARFEKARLKLEKLQSGPTTHELRPAGLTLEEAAVELDLARKEMGSRLAGLEQSVAWSRAEVWRFEERLRRTKWKLEQCTIKAPRAGLALRVHRHWERGKVDAGMRTWPGIAIAELPDLSAFKVKTQIPESMIRHFNVGDKVPVEIEGLEGRAFTGTVTWIDAWARDKNAELAEADQKREGLSGLRVFAADVALDETDEHMKLGSAAKVELRNVLEDAVFVDRRAVEWRGAKPYVRTLGGDGSPVFVPVVLGESNEHSFVVLRGVESGTPVVFREGT